MTAAATVRPGRGWYAMGAILCLAGAVAFPVSLFVAGIFCRETRFLSSNTPIWISGSSRPGIVLHRGTYVLWHETNTTFKARRYGDKPLPAGATFSMFRYNLIASPAIPTLPTGGETRTCGRSTQKAVAYFDIPAKGNYIVFVGGVNEDAVLVLKRSRADPISLAALAGELLSVVGFFGGMVVILVTAMRRQPVGERPASELPAAARP